MEDKEIKNLKDKIVGKQLKQIIYLKIDDRLKGWINVQLDNQYHYEIDMAQLLIFEDRFLLFVDLDCDGYRSGDWHIKHFKTFAKSFLDKGHTEEIKIINGIVKNVEYYEESYSLADSTHSEKDTTFFMIETDNYIIQMGQRNVNDYYPSNFFCVEEIKDLILKRYWDKK